MIPVKKQQKKTRQSKERKDRKQYSKITYGKRAVPVGCMGPGAGTVDASSGGKMTGFRRSRKCRQEGEIVKGIVVHAYIPEK